MPTPKTKTTEQKLCKLSERNERLFPSHPQVSRYFPATAIEEARLRIARAIERGDGPGLVIGLPGTGKSLLLQVLAAQYQERFDVVLLACARLCTRRALFQAILFELGLPYQSRDEGTLRLNLLDHLLSSEKCPSGLLLLVDEAQTLPIALLDELRVLTNLVRAGAPRVRLVLAGSSALEECFAHPELESLSQRLSARCYLSPLNREETSRFIQAQVASSGSMPNEVFAADAWDAIFDATDGVPRLVNQLCDRALSEAVAAGHERVDRDVIQRAWSGLQQLPTPWEMPVSKSAATAAAPQVIEFGQLLSDEPVDCAPTSRRSSFEPCRTETAFDTEPTELDFDDDTIDCAKPSLMVTDRKTAIQSASANPFAENFAEEEVVLDNFAAWDNLFRRDTPRVQNRRDPNFAALVQSAAAAVPGASRDATAAHDAEHAIEPESEWPPLRLAMVSDPLPPKSNSMRVSTPPATLRYAAVFERMLAEPDAAEGSNGNLATFKSASDDVDSGDECASDDVPILIIEDDHSARSAVTPPVRREEYRHLFSRLRSG